MLAVIIRTIKDRKWSILVYILAGVLFVWMYVGMFPTFSDKKEEFKQVMDAYPESIMETFGVKDAAAIFDNIENFIATENYSFLWPIMLIALAVSLGGYSIAGEIERKTIETLLSEPISRLRLFWAKYIAGLVLILFFVIITVLSLIPLCELHNVEYNTMSHITMLGLGSLFGWAIFSITTLFSALFNEKSKPYFFSVGILILMYALNIVASLKDNLSDLKYGSFFYYFDSTRALLDQTITWEALLIFGGISVVTTIAAAIIFDRRNITVA